MFTNWKGIKFEYINVTWKFFKDDIKIKLLRDTFYALGPLITCYLFKLDNFVCSRNQNSELSPFNEDEFLMNVVRTDKFNTSVAT